MEQEKETFKAFIQSCLDFVVNKRIFGKAKPKERRFDEVKNIELVKCL